jgi:hypothetical protein
MARGGRPGGDGRGGRRRAEWARPRAAAEPSPPTWAQPVPAPIAPRMGVAAVTITPDKVLVFGGSFAAGGWVAMQPVVTPQIEMTDAAVLDVSTGNWRPATPPPTGVVPDGYGAVGSSGFAWMFGDLRTANVDRRGHSKGRVLLRFDLANNSWTKLPLSPVPGHLIAAGDRLVALNLRPDRPGKDPSGAVLEPSGRWRVLPPTPFRNSTREEHRYLYAPRDAVWTGTELLASNSPLAKGSTQPGHEVELAALDLDRKDATWATRPSIDAPEGLGWRPDPVVVSGLVVWPMLVYDPATGTSTPTPLQIREYLRKHPGDPNPPGGPARSGLRLGDAVTLAGYVFSPVTGATVRIPTRPIIPGSDGAWVGGPAGIVGIAGMLSAGVMNTGHNLVFRLLPGD